jgi:hypothetical protein
MEGSGFVQIMKDPETGGPKTYFTKLYRSMFKQKCTTKTGTAPLLLKSSMPISEHSLGKETHLIVTTAQESLWHFFLFQTNTTLTMASEVSEPGARTEQEAGVGAAPSPLTHVWVRSPQEPAHRRPAPTLTLLLL